MTYVKLVLPLMLCASFVASQGGGSLKTGTASVPHVPEKGSVEHKAIVDVGQEIPRAEGSIHTVDGIPEGRPRVVAGDLSLCEGLPQTQVCVTAPQLNQPTKQVIRLTLISHTGDCRLCRKADIESLVRPGNDRKAVTRQHARVLQEKGAGT